MITATRPATYAKGFETLEQETVIDALPVSGELPAWLSGSLLRTGPAKFEAGARPFNHWFDGLAMLHRFTFGDGRVSYGNRFLDAPINAAGVGACVNGIKNVAEIIRAVEHPVAAGVEGRCIHLPGKRQRRRHT